MALGRLREMSEMAIRCCDDDEHDKATAMKGRGGGGAEGQLLVETQRLRESVVIVQVVGNYDVCARALCSCMRQARRLALVV